MNDQRLSRGAQICLEALDSASVDPINFGSVRLTDVRRKLWQAFGRIPRATVQSYFIELIRAGLIGDRYRSVAVTALAVTEPYIRQQIRQKNDGRCVYCGVGFTASGPTRFCVDHKVSIFAGGTNDLDNLVPSCIACNSRKGHIDRKDHIKMKEVRHSR